MIVKSILGLVLLVVVIVVPNTEQAPQFTLMEDYQQPNFSPRVREFLQRLTEDGVQDHEKINYLAEVLSAFSYYKYNDTNFLEHCVGQPIVLDGYRDVQIQLKSDGYDLYSDSDSQAQQREDFARMPYLTAYEKDDADVEEDNYDYDQADADANTPSKSIQRNGIDGHTEEDEETEDTVEVEQDPEDLNHRFHDEETEDENYEQHEGDDDDYYANMTDDDDDQKEYDQDQSIDGHRDHDAENKEEYSEYEEHTDYPQEDDKEERRRKQDPEDDHRGSHSRNGGKGYPEDEDTTSYDDDYGEEEDKNGSVEEDDHRRGSPKFPIRTEGGRGKSDERKGGNRGSNYAPTGRDRPNVKRPDHSKGRGKDYYKGQRVIQPGPIDDVYSPYDQDQSYDPHSSGRSRAGFQEDEIDHSGDDQDVMSLVDEYLNKIRLNDVPNNISDYAITYLDHSKNAVRIYAGQIKDFELIRPCLEPFVQYFNVLTDDLTNEYKRCGERCYQDRINYFASSVSQYTVITSQCINRAAEV